MSRKKYELEKKFADSIINEDTETAIHCLKQGIKIKSNRFLPYPPIVLAIRHNNYKLFQLLVEKGASVSFVNENQDNLLHSAAYEADSLSELIKFETDKERKKRYQKSLDETLKIIKQLLILGVALDKKNNLNHSPFEAAGHSSEAKKIINEYQKNKFINE